MEENKIYYVVLFDRDYDNNEVQAVFESKEEAEEYLKLKINIEVEKYAEFRASREEPDDLVTVEYKRNRLVHNYSINEIESIDLSTMRKEGN